MSNELMSIAEAAAALGVDDSTVRRYVYAKKLPATQIGDGTKILVSRAAVEEIVSRAHVLPDKGDMRGPSANTMSASSSPYRGKGPR